MTAVAQRVKVPPQKKVDQITVTDRSRERSSNAKNKIGVQDPIPANAIRVNVRYRKEYVYHWTEGVFAGSGPTSCDEFLISALLGEGNVRPRNPIPIGSVYSAPIVSRFPLGK